MKRRFRLAPLLLLLLLIQGCLFLPKVSRDQSYPGCELVTRELDLAVVEGGDLFHEVFRQNRGCVNEACLAVLAGLVTVPAGSFVISGSIVIVGNTLHWFEAQGRCEEGALHYLGEKLSLLTRP